MCDHHDHDHDHDHDHGDGHDDHDHDHGDGHEQADEDDGDGGYGAHEDDAIRIAVTGKGGVGKSTLAAALATELARETDVLAIDADPDANLARAIGCANPPAITGERELIEGRVGERGGLLTLTPEVDDVLESHSSTFASGGRLLTIGAPTGGNTGCLCPENSFVQSLVRSALETDHVVMDMEAGIEHLGRGTADAVDAMLVVVEPSLASLDTAERIETLAADLEIPTYAIVNKARGDVSTVTDTLEMPVLATLEYDERVAEAALRGDPVVEASLDLREGVRDVIESIR